MKGRRPSGGAASVHVLPVVFRLMRHAVRGGGRLLLWIRPEGVFPEGVLPLRVIEHLRHEALMSAIWRYGNDAVFSFRGKNPFLRAAFFPHALFAGKRSVARREPGRPYGEKAPGRGRARGFWRGGGAEKRGVQRAHAPAGRDRREAWEGSPMNGPLREAGVIAARTDILPEGKHGWGRGPEFPACARRRLQHARPAGPRRPAPLCPRNGRCVFR